MRLILLDPVEVCLYQQGQAEPDVDMQAYPFLLDPGETAEDADWRSGGSVPNQSITLSNAEGQLVPFLRNPPRRARLEDDAGVELFSGTVDSIELDQQTAQLVLVA